MSTIYHSRKISTVDYLSKCFLKENNQLVRAEERKGRGVSISAKCDLVKGTKVMDCYATSIALDPPYRFNNCGFCAKKHPCLRLCTTCRIVAFCPSCDESKKQRHDSECHALREVVNILSDRLESIFLLVIRILCLKYESKNSINNNNNKNNEWKLLDCLHEAVLPDSIVAGISVICKHLKRLKRYEWFEESACRDVLARVLSCSHAITDITLPLGSQYLGRAIFLHHSFFNHRCAPNAFLSCVLTTAEEKAVQINNSASATTISGVRATVHTLSDIKQGDEITLSYIPTSGLALQERQQRLQEGFGFVCDCEACKNPGTLVLPSENNVDVDSIREIQFSCNERLLNLQNRFQKKSNTMTCNEDKEDGDNDDEIEQIISLIEMTKRGIQYQKIPCIHEVSIEVHRLLAMAYTLGKEYALDDVIEQCQRFFVQTKKLNNMFDPVALATQHLYLSNFLLQQNQNGQIKNFEEKQQMHYKKGMELLEISVGSEHPFVTMQILLLLPERKPVKKKPKLS